MKQTISAVLMTLMLCLTACDQNGNLDVNLGKVDRNWDVVGMGQDKPLILRVLGQPDYVEQVSVLGVETERMIWDGYARRYQLDLVMGRVVAKHIDGKSFR